MIIFVVHVTGTWCLNFSRWLDTCFNVLCSISWQHWVQTGPMPEYKSPIAPRNKMALVGSCQGWEGMLRWNEKLLEFTRDKPSKIPEISECHTSEGNWNADKSCIDRMGCHCSRFVSGICWLSRRDFVFHVCWSDSSLLTRSLCYCNPDTAPGFWVCVFVCVCVCVCVCVLYNLDLCLLLPRPCDVTARRWHANEVPAGPDEAEVVWIGRGGLCGETHICSRRTFRHAHLFSVHRFWRSW